MTAPTNLIASILTILAGIILAGIILADAITNASGKDGNTMANLDKWKYGRRRQTFCPKCGKRTRMAGLCAACQREKEAKNG